MDVRYANTPGEATWKEIGEKRRSYDKFLVICSAGALSRDGVLKEIEQQIDEDLSKIVPISIDAEWLGQDYQVKRGKYDLKPFLIHRNYADFVSKPFEEALDRLVLSILNPNGPR